MSNLTNKLPDWWQREHQRRMNHLLVLLVLLISLIAFFYYINFSGVTGIIKGVNFSTEGMIAFVRKDSTGNTSLYAIRADRTNLRQLTPASDKSDKSAPAWNLQGDQIFYASNRDDAKKQQIYILGASDPRQLTYGIGRKENPQITRDGSRVAFLAVGAVKTVLTNGNEVDQVLPLPRMEGNSGAEGVPGDPDVSGPFLNFGFSADGRGIAGVRELSNDNNFLDIGLKGLVGGDQIVQVVTPDGNHTLQLDAGNAVSFSWESGNGNRLLVSYAESPRPIDEKGHIGLVGGITLYTFDKPNHAVGRPIILSTGLGMMPRNVAWSPDGSHIAFEAWMLKGEKQRELMGIVMMTLADKPIVLHPQDSKGFRPSLPTTPDGQPHNPRWSPDGSRLLFEVTRKDNGNDLCVINYDMTNLMNLTEGKGDNTQGTWSPAKK